MILESRIKQSNLSEVKGSMNDIFNEGDYENSLEKLLLFEIH
jgi:hypothetical protein